MSKTSRYLISTVVIALLAGPVGAELFTVTLTNGKTFDTRYQPVQSATDENKLSMLTDTGNWISLSKDVVVSIASQTEAKGFGIVIDTQTIALGWDPTSVAAQQEEAAAVDPTTRLLNYLESQDRALSQPAPPPFSNQQFVEPSEAGGIPLWMTTTTTPPLGGER